MQQSISHFSKRLSLLLFLIISVCPLVALSSLAEEMQVAGKYSMRGRSINHKIKIPPSPPAAVIVVQYLPPGTDIKSAEPEYSSYDKEHGVVKWLFTDVKPGRLKIRLELAHDVDRSKVRAEALFKDSKGQSSTFALIPRPMKRKAIEGC